MRDRSPPRPKESSRRGEPGRPTAPPPPPRLRTGPGAAGPHAEGSRPADRAGQRAPPFPRRVGRRPRGGTYGRSGAGARVPVPGCRCPVPVPVPPAAPPSPRAARPGRRAGTCSGSRRHAPPRRAAPRPSRESAASRETRPPHSAAPAHHAAAIT